MLPALHDKLAEYRARAENMPDTLVSEHRHVALRDGEQMDHRDGKLDRLRRLVQVGVLDMESSPPGVAAWLYLASRGPATPIAPHARI